MFGAVMTCHLQSCATAHSLAPGCCSICCPRPSPKIFRRIEQDLAGLQKFLSDIEIDLVGLTAIPIGLNWDLKDIPTTIDEVITWHFAPWPFLSVEVELGATIFLFKP